MQTQHGFPYSAYKEFQNHVLRKVFKIIKNAMKLLIWLRVRLAWDGMHANKVKFLIVETFHDHFPFTLRVFARNLLRGNRRRNNFSYFVLMSGLWDSNPGFSSNKPTHYLLD